MSSHTSCFSALLGEQYGQHTMTHEHEDCEQQPLRIRFGERLRQLRHDRHYTQQQLADHLGIDRSFLSDVECGKKNLSLYLADTIARGFHLNLAELLRDL